jgi:NitT/TauT family transport system permease protein
MSMAATAPLVGFGTQRVRGFLGLCSLLLFWEFAARYFGAGANPVIPPPTILAGYFYENLSFLIVAVQPTLIEAVAGFFIGAGISIVLAILFVRYPTVEATLSNSVVMLHCLPLLAIVPLLVIWFGIGFTPKIIMASLATFFPVLNGALRGLRSAEQPMLDLMYILDAHWLQTLVKVRIPASLPYIFAGLKIAAPQAVLGATVAEWIGSRSGLGSQILIALLNYDVPLLWASMVMCAVVAGIGFCLVVMVEYLVVGRRSEPMAREVE